MASGRTLSGFAAVLTLLATFVFSWYSLDIPPKFYSNGLGIINNLPAMFTDADSIATALDIPTFSIYIIAVCLILLLASGILQLIGVTSRIAIFFGSLMPISIGILLFFTNADILDKALWIENVFGIEDQLGPLPLELIGENLVDVGGYLLLAGGVIGMISIFLPRE